MESVSRDIIVVGAKSRMMVVNDGIVKVNKEFSVVGVKPTLQHVKLSKVSDVNECILLGENLPTKVING